MIAVESPPQSIFAALPVAPAAIHGARDLARLYDLQTAAAWRGDPAASDFFTWLSAHRRPAPAAAGVPAAISPHGAGGRSIAWYDTPDTVVGHIPGAAWGYEIPRGAELPAPHAEADRFLVLIGRLHPDEVETVLHGQRVGRLACLADGRPYVVPITYAYAGGDVYGHALPGRKIAALRGDPHVCFEVDERLDGETWRSVVAEGTYEELTNPAERRTALALLHRTDAFAHPITGDAPGIVFRLRLTTKSGRIVNPHS